MSFEHNEVLWMCFDKKKDRYPHYVFSFKIKKLKVWIFRQKKQMIFCIEYGKHHWQKNECMNLINFIMKKYVWFETLILRNWYIYEQARSSITGGQGAAPTPIFLVADISL